MNLSQPTPSSSQDDTCSSDKIFVNVTANDEPDSTRRSLSKNRDSSAEIIDDVPRDQQVNSAMTDDTTTRTMRRSGGGEVTVPNHGALKDHVQSWSRKWRDKFHKEEDLFDQNVRDETDDQRHEEDHEGNDKNAEETIFKVQHRYLPILSGLVCPFSVLLDIPGLTERWYVRTYGFDVVETQPNPVLLDVAQAISMVFGVLANLALISRFLERKPYISTWVAIIGLTLHDIISICTVTIFGVIHRFSDGFTYGTAFWLTVAATVASLFVNITLIIDLVRTRNFKANGSGLTEKQRSLVIAVMSLLCYIGLGSLVFSFIEELSYIDSMYFTIVTVTSVGFGDIIPTKLSAKIFSFFYDTAGLVLLAFTIAIARETVIETFEANYRARRDVLAKRARQRKEEKKRRAREKRERLEKHLRERLENGDDPNRDFVTNNEDAIGFGGGRGRSRIATSLGVRTSSFRADQAAKRALDFCDEKDQGFSTIQVWSRWFKRALGILPSYIPDSLGTSRNDTLELGGEDDGDTTVIGSDLKEGRSLERSLTSTSTTSRVAEEKFKTFKQQLHAEQKNEFRLKITMALSLFLVFWLVGAAVFHLTERWTYFDSLWFCFVFFTTIGYGDFSPKSNAGRAFFIAWALFGIANMTLTLSVVTETWSSRYKSSINDGKARRRLNRLTRLGHSNDAKHASALRLLALEGFQKPEEIEAKDLPTKLTDAIKGFHDHARYFMLGRTGDVPDDLKPLFEMANEFDDELENIVDEGSLEAGNGGDTRHFLFMVSYERQFDNLLDTAERLTQVFKSHEDELATMRDLNNQLRNALKNSTADNDEDSYDDKDDSKQSSPKPKLLPFDKRPPGGFGDEEVEKKLARELDNDDDDDDDDNNDEGIESNEKTRRARIDPTTLQEPDARVNRSDSRSIAEDTLERTSTFVDRILSSECVERNTVHTGSSMPSGLSTPDPSGIVQAADDSAQMNSPTLRSRRASSAFAIPRVPTLTFVEPDRDRAGSSSTTPKVRGYTISSPKSGRYL